MAGFTNAEMVSPLLAYGTNLFFLGTSVLALSGKVKSNPPTAVVVSPSPGSTIATITPIIIDVLDDVGLGRVILVARFGSQEEVIHQGSHFGPLYTGSRWAVAGGYRYSFARLGGWSSPLSIDVYAIDLDGSEAS